MSSEKKSPCRPLPLTRRAAFTHYLSRCRGDRRRFSDEVGVFHGLLRGEAGRQWWPTGKCQVTGSQPHLPCRLRSRSAIVRCRERRCERATPAMCSWDYVVMNSRRVAATAAEAAATAAAAAAAAAGVAAAAVAVSAGAATAAAAARKGSRSSFARSTGSYGVLVPLHAPPAPPSPSPFRSS